MGKVTGFLEYERLDEPHEDSNSRKRHYREFYLRLPDEDAKIQGARCMDCGIPFCMQGCPVNNIIPDFNDLVYREDWQRAIETLHSTNNFPEFTGRICPAPCEEACVLRINEDPVGIKSIEHAIIDKAWESGWVKAQPAAHQIRCPDRDHLPRLTGRRAGCAVARGGTPVRQADHHPVPRQRSGGDTPAGTSPVQVRHLGSASA